MLPPIGHAASESSSRHAPGAAHRRDAACQDGDGEARATTKGISRTPKYSASAWLSHEAVHDGVDELLAAFVWESAEFELRLICSGKSYYLEGLRR